MREWWNRLRGWISSRPSVENELAEELRSHLEMETESFLDRGMALQQPGVTRCGAKLGEDGFALTCGQRPACPFNSRRRRAIGRLGDHRLDVGNRGAACQRREYDDDRKLGCGPQP